jgi:ABC-type glycerol-3-phosphate transport system substrate-binding protein
MRRLAVFGALLLVAAGCGGGSKSTQSGASPTENPIAAAATKTSQAGSVKIDFGISGKAVNGGGRGAFDTSSTGGGRLAMTVEGNSGGATTVDTISSGNLLYIRSPVFQQAIPPGKEWVRVDLAKLAKQNGVDG